MEEITRVGVDLAKRDYQVHTVDSADLIVLARPMSPERFLSWAEGSGMVRSKLSPDSGRPEDGLCLAKGQASGLPRPARPFVDVQSVPRYVAAVQNTGLEMKKTP